MNDSRISRRAFLKGGLATTAMAPFAGAAAEPPSDKGIVDAHVHVWTPDTAKYPLAESFTSKDMQPASFTPEQLFTHCRPEGVDRIVLIQMSFYQFDNTYMLDCMEKYPGVFGGVGIVDWFKDRPDRDMDRLAKKGVRGFRVTFRGAESIDTWAEAPGLVTMFRHAAATGLAICPLMDPRGIPSLARMCERFPGANVVIDHFCRIGIDGEIRKVDLDALCGLAAHPQVHVKVSAFYALGQKRPPHEDLEPMIRRVHDAFGADRLMWASDCPYAVDNEKYRDSVSLVRDGCEWMSSAGRESLLRGTATRLFF